MKSSLFGWSRSLRAAALFALLPVIAARPAAASFSSCVAGCTAAGRHPWTSWPGGGLGVLMISTADGEALGGLAAGVAQQFEGAELGLGFTSSSSTSMVADGRATMAAVHVERSPLAAAAAFGVDRHVIAAVWGVETDRHGREAGDNYLPHALADAVGARAAGAPDSGGAGQLIAALKLVDDGDLRLDALRLLGRRLRADAVHPLHLSAPRPSILMVRATLSVCLATANYGGRPAAGLSRSDPGSRYRPATTGRRGHGEQIIPVERRGARSGDGARPSAGRPWRRRPALWPGSQAGVFVFLND